MKRSHVALVVLGIVTASVGTRAAIGFRPTAHSVEKASLGAPTTMEAMEALLDQPGPVTVETIVGADWAVTRAGLINLDDPKARAAGLKDGDEPIVIQFHAIHHPTRGLVSGEREELFLVDTGIERAVRDDPAHSAIGSGAVVSKFMHLEKLKVKTDTASWLAGHEKPAGVFLTHLHMDHVSGMRDVPNDVPIYVGPGEAREKNALNFFVKPVTDSALEGKGALRELAFNGEEPLDLFGDGTVFALWVPGHTAGSVAFVLRTPNGPVLLTGDACHTAWGWKNGVEPGSFSEDRPASRRSLERLEQLAARHPKMDVRLGHQSL
jgi:glyoxylase-like metal-dependent hydrolase (beta-lactamase superfamily II)